MKFLYVSALVCAGALAVSTAHAQMNQVFGAIHSAQYAVTSVKKLMPQHDTAQQQAQQAQQQRVDYLKQHPPCNANCPLDADDKQKYEAMQRRDQQEGQQQLDAAQKVVGICPDLANTKYNRAEQFIRCRNKGMSEEQEMTYVGGFPLLAQAYLSSMVQDVFEDNVTDPRRGKEITDYYLGCFDRGVPCNRRKW